MDLPKRLKELRLSRGLSQHQLAYALNMTPSSISAYETNVRTPQADAIIKLANFFDVSTDYLLCVNDSVNTTTREIVNVKKYQSKEFPLLRENDFFDDFNMDHSDYKTFSAYTDVNAHFCVGCIDDSMAGFGIITGDTLFIKILPQDEINNHDIVAIAKGHQALIRRMNTDIPGKILYEASDKESESIVIDENDENSDVKLIGKVTTIHRAI